MVGGVCSERDCGGNRAGTDSERQGERIKRAAKNVGRIHVLLDLAAFIRIFLFEHGPAVGDDDKAAADLDHRNGNTEESEDVRSNEVGSDDKDKTVQGDAPRQETASGGSVVSGKRKEDGAPADRVNDGKEGADDEKDTFGDFEHGNLRAKYSRGRENDSGGRGGRRLELPRNCQQEGGTPPPAFRKYSF